LFSDNYCLTIFLSHGQFLYDVDGHIVGTKVGGHCLVCTLSLE